MFKIWIEVGTETKLRLLWGLASGVGNSSKTLISFSIIFILAHCIFRFSLWRPQQRKVRGKHWANHCVWWSPKWSRNLQTGIYSLSKNLRVRGATDPYSIMWNQSRAKRRKILYLYQLGFYINMPIYQRQTLGNISQIIFPESLKCSKESFFSI